MANGGLKKAACAKILHSVLRYLSTTVLEDINTEFFLIKPFKVYNPPQLISCFTCPSLSQSKCSKKQNSNFINICTL